MTKEEKIAMLTDAIREAETREETCRLNWVVASAQAGALRVQLGNLTSEN